MARQSSLRSLRFSSHESHLHVFGNAVKRAAEETSASLSVGAIAGIAVSCGIALFMFLAFIVICCSRKRHRRLCLTSRRKLDLGDDDDSPVGTERPPHELNPIKSVSSKPLFHELDLNVNGWYTKSQGQGAVKTESGEVAPSAYAFHITASRDSWPLVSWKTPKVGVTEGPNMLPPAVIQNPDGPPQDGSRPFQHPQGLPIGLMPRQFGLPIHAKHARQLSRSSTNLSKRGSATDSQLTTILRSTSERLKDAQAAATSSQTPAKPSRERDSILSPIGCDPPTEKAPSPLKDQTTSESRGNLAPSPSLRDHSHSTSPKSSVLDLFAASRAPSRAESTHPAGRETPQRVNPSDDEDDNDSLCGITPDHVIPAALTSPSKREKTPDSEQRRRMRISSQETGTKIHEDNRASLVPFGARDIFIDVIRPLRNHDRKNSESSDDPFVTKGSSAAQSQSRAASPFLTYPDLQPRKTALGSSNDLPLRSVGGNNQSNIPEPAKRISADMGIIQPRTSFHWISNPNSDSTMPSQPQIIAGGITQSQTKGHKRSTVVRLQAPPLQRNSIAIVPEENEEATPPKSLSNPSGTALPTDNTASGLNNIVFLPRSSSRLSIMTDRSSLHSAPPSPSSAYNSRPSSLSHFRFPPVAPSTAREIPGRLSHNSYSATLSLYDCYTSTEGARTQSRSRSCSRDRYHRRSSSALSLPLAQAQKQPQSYGTEHRRKSSVSSAVGVSFIIPGEKLAKEQQQQEDKIPAPLPPRTLSIRGPQHRRPLPRDSVQHSIGLLRRMNSTVSTLSAHDSIASEGSPTLPAYRGGGCGVSPTKSFRRGSSNYLGIAGRRMSDTPPMEWSPAKEERRVSRGGSLRGEGMAVVREMHTPRLEGTAFFAAMPGGNALGLRMPVLEKPEQMGVVRSSPGEAGRALGSKGAAEVERKDSAVDMRRAEGKKERPARYGGRARREGGKRGSLYDEKGFLKSSPVRGEGMI